MKSYHNNLTSSGIYTPSELASTQHSSNNRLSSKQKQEFNDQETKNQTLQPVNQHIINDKVSLKNDENANKTAEFQQMRKKCNDLSNRMRRAQTIQRQSKELYEKINTINRENQKLRSQNIYLEVEANFAEQQAARNKYIRKIEELQNLINQRDEQISQLKQIQYETNASLNKNRQKNDKSVQQLKLCREANQKINQQLKNITVKLELKIREFKSHKDCLGTLQSKIHLVQYQNKQKYQSIICNLQNQMIKKVDKKNIEYGQLQENYDIIHVKCNQKQFVIQEKNQIIIDQQLKIKEQQNNLKMIKQQFQQEKQEVIEGRQKMKQLQDKIRKLQNQIDDLKLSKKREKRALSTQLSKQQHNNSELVRQRQDFGQKIEDLNQQINKKERKINKLQAQILDYNALKQKILRLLEQSTIIQKYTISLQEQIKVMEKIINKMKIKLTQDIQKCQNNQLNQIKIQQLIDNCDQISKKIVHLQQQLFLSNNKNLVLQSENKILKITQSNQYKQDNPESLQLISNKKNVQKVIHKSSESMGMNIKKTVQSALNDYTYLKKDTVSYKKFIRGDRV